MRGLAFIPRGWDDYTTLEETDKTMHRCIKARIKAELRDPYAGEGNPETLKRASCKTP